MGKHVLLLKAIRTKTLMSCRINSLHRNAKLTQGDMVTDMVATRSRSLDTASTPHRHIPQLPRERRMCGSFDDLCSEHGRLTGHYVSRDLLIRRLLFRHVSDWSCSRHQRIKGEVMPRTFEFCDNIILNQNLPRSIPHILRYLPVYLPYYLSHIFIDW